MDEILIANFMVFHDLTADEPYDLWIADEGWDVDYFLFDNPELKRRAYAWLTDFTGWLPMPDGGAARQPSPRTGTRRDRADAALPAAAGPVDLRRKPWRPGGRPARAGPAERA